MASGELGKKCITAMAMSHEKVVREHTIAMAATVSRRPSTMPERDLDEMVVTNEFPFLVHVLVHFRRSFLCITRDPLLFVFRFVLHIGMALFLGALFTGKNIGSAPGCPPPLRDTNDPTKFAEVQDMMEEERKAIQANLGFWFFGAIFLQFCALMPTVLTFPLESESLTFRLHTVTLTFDLEKMQ